MRTAEAQPHRAIRRLERVLGGSPVAFSLFCFLSANNDFCRGVQLVVCPIGIIILALSQATRENVWLVQKKYNKNVIIKICT